MTKEFIKLEQEGNGKPLGDLILEFEAFASDILEQLASISDAELNEKGVSVLLDNNKLDSSIKYSFSHGETTYTLEKRRLNLGSLWPKETIIGCCYPKGGKGFRFEAFKSLVCSDTVQEGATYSTKHHFNKYFRFKNERNGEEALVVRVSPLHYIKGDANEFSFALKDEEEKAGSNTLRSVLPEDEFYGKTTYSSFSVAHDTGWAALEEMRAGWSFALKKLGVIPGPYQREKTPQA